MDLQNFYEFINTNIAPRDPIPREVIQSLISNQSVSDQVDLLDALAGHNFKEACMSAILEVSSTSISYVQKIVDNLSKIPSSYDGKVLLL